MASVLDHRELKLAMAALIAILDQEQVQYAFMGGCAVITTAEAYGANSLRFTSDLDLVMRPDSRFRDASDLSNHLIRRYPDQILETLQYGISIPAVRVPGTGKVAEVEIFDFRTWHNRPQYNLDSPDNTRASLSVRGVDFSGTNYKVIAFDSKWLLREKILTFFQRGSTAKGDGDLEDIQILLVLVRSRDKLKLTKGIHDAYIEAVRSLYERYPNFRSRLMDSIDSADAFWTWNEQHQRYYRHDETNGVVWA